MKSFDRGNETGATSDQPSTNSNITGNGRHNSPQVNTPELPATTGDPYLSVVIPAYNESGRLRDTLAKVLDYLESQPYNSELLIVDDGSKDDTAAIVRSAIAERNAENSENSRKVSLKLKAEPHRGKGATVQAGMLAGQGEYILFSDADLCTPIDEVERLLKWLEEGYDVAAGSREGQGARRMDEPFYRHLMGRVFNLLVRFVTQLDMQDTQCGFKAFRRAAAHDLFRRVQLYNTNSGEVKGAMVTGFDVEVLFLAKKRHYKIKEVPVTWYHIKGSKVNPIKDTLLMVGDVLKLRLNVWRGVYKD